MTIGQALRQRREELGFSGKEIADDIQVPAAFIDAIERGEFSQLPARVYTRGFLKKYALYLDLPPDALLAEFDAVLGQEADGARPAGEPRPAFYRGAFDFLDQKRIVLGIVLVIFAMFGVYFLYEFRHILISPVMTLRSPAADMVTADDALAVVGVLEKEADLTVNGRPIYVDENGVFRDSVLLAKGLNTLVFEATNRFGKTRIITRYILVE